MSSKNLNPRATSSGGEPDKAPLLQIRVAYLSMEPRTGLLNFLDHLDGRLLTHVILAFARVDPISGQMKLNCEEDKQYLSQVGPFKRKYPHIRVLISVNNEPPSDGASTLGNSTGMNAKLSSSVDNVLNHQSGEHDNDISLAPSDLHHLHNSHASSLNHVGPFNKLAQSSQMRQKFARSAMEFLKCYSLDGIDIDWEFPNFPHYFGINRECEKTGLTKIIMELRSAIVEDFFDRQVAEQHQQHSSSHNNHNHINNNHYSHNNHHSSSLTTANSIEDFVKPHLLTLAIGAQDTILRSSYELKLLANLIDWFNVMSYDYYMFKAYSPFTGPNSPLKPIVDPIVPVLGKLSFQTTLNRLVSENLDKDKIIMGVPTYARAYRLLFKNSYPTPLTLAYGSRSGSYSAEYMSYEEVCDILAKPETIVCFDKRARVPYLLTDDGYTWVSYENDQSVTEKINLIIENQLGGYMTWNLNSDFFHSKLNNNDNMNLNSNNFPLHRALFEAAKGNQV